MLLHACCCCVTWRPQDQQSRELSQRHTGRKAKKLRVREADVKLGRVVGLDACTVRERDWANVITAHEGDPTAYVWRLAHFTLGEHELSPPQEPGAGGAGGPSRGACCLCLWGMLWGIADGGHVDMWLWSRALLI